MTKEVEVLLLLCVALVLPGLWGFLVHWAMQRLWPHHQRWSQAPAGAQSPQPEERFVDYEI